MMAHTTNTSIKLHPECYKWLVTLNILKPYIIPTSPLTPTEHPNHHQHQLIEVCYDDQLYLENGYLIGMLLKDILKEHELYSEKLMKIRKITVLKKYENWEIVYDVLGFLEYEEEPIDEEGLQEEEEKINETNHRQQLITTIQHILHFLYHHYGPLSYLHKQQNQPKRHFHIEPEKLQRIYDKLERNEQLDGVKCYNYEDCNNLLEYVVMVLMRGFCNVGNGVKVGECLGLLVDEGKVLKGVVVKGLRGGGSNDDERNNNNNNSSTTVYNPYHCVEIIYQELIQTTEHYFTLLAHEPHHLPYMLSIFTIGALSHSPKVAILTKQYLESIISPESKEWLLSDEGLKILLQSQHPLIIFPFVIEQSLHKFAYVFKIEYLSKLFTYDEDFLLFLQKLLPIISKSRYCKEIMEELTLELLLEKVLEVFVNEHNGDVEYEKREQNNEDNNIKRLSRELLTTIFKHFFKSLTEEQRSLSIISFETRNHLESSIIPISTKFSLIETIEMLTQLFEIIKVFLINEDAAVEKWFKIALKYMNVQNQFQQEVKEFVMLNLSELYNTLGVGFPLGAFLLTYYESFFGNVNNDNCSINYIDSNNNNSNNNNMLNKPKHKKKSCANSNATNNKINNIILSSLTTTILTLKLINNNHSNEHEQHEHTINTIETNINTIPQSIDYQLLEKISHDPSLIEDEVLNALNITTLMYAQINGSAFNKIIENLIRFKESSEWVNILCHELLNKWTEIKLPSLTNSSPYNRKSPLEKCKFEAFGIKRREILRFEEYKKCKMLLELFCQIKDKEFLTTYHKEVNKKLQEINKNIEQKPYSVFLKKLLEKIKLSKDMIREESIDTLLDKSFVYSREEGNCGDRIIDGNININSDRLDDDKNDEIIESRVARYKKGLVNSGIIEEALSEEEEHNNNEHEITNNNNNNNSNEFLSPSLSPTQSLELKENISNNNFNNNIEEHIQHLHQHKHLHDFTLQEQEHHHHHNYQTSTEELPILLEEEMEQHEIVFLKIMRENYPEVVHYCADRFFCIELESKQFKLKEQEANIESIKEPNKYESSENIMKQFLNTIKINKYVTISEGQQLLTQINKQFPNINTDGQEFTWHLLTQLAFTMFGYRRNTRIRIKLVETFLNLLKNSLKQEIQLFISNSRLENTTKMKRNIEYENELIINKLLKWNGHWENVYLRSERVVEKSNKMSREEMVGHVLESYHNGLKEEKEKQQEIQKSPIKISQEKEKYEMKRIIRNELEPWLICYQVLNDIFNSKLISTTLTTTTTENNIQTTQKTNKKPLAIGLIEPMSKVIMRVVGEDNINDDNLKNTRNIDNNNQSLHAEEGGKENVLISEREEELLMLEKELQQQANRSKLSSSLSPSSNKLSLSPMAQRNRLLKKPESSTKKLPNQDLIFTNSNLEKLPSQFSKLSTTELKQKINSRKEQLESEIKKEQELKINNRQNENKMISDRDNNNNIVNDEKKEFITYKDIVVDSRTRREVEQIISFNVDKKR